MRKSKQLFSLLVITLLLGGVLSSSAMAKGDRPVKLDGRGTFQTDTGIQSLTALTLKESSDEGVTWTSVYGNMTSGYTMLLSGTENETVYLDVEYLTASPALKVGDYPFYLDPVRVPAEFWTYWEGQGVDENAADWQGVMWQIINGDLPIFYLRVSSTGSQLIDGLAWQTQQKVLPARVSADYPLHTYNFGGQVEDVNSETQDLVIGITYTRAVTPSLWKGGVELVPYIDVEEPGTPIVIDGCGYVDVTIRLENVYNLYAVELSLTFDPDFVEVVDQLPVETTNPGINLLPIAPWDDPETAYTVKNIAYNEDDPGTPLVNEAGTIRFIASLLNTQDPITDNLDGLDVATIRLRAKDLGATMLSITGMELSDRDGYLVGVPLTEPVDYAVTTQFSIDGGLNLGITRFDASTVQLNWPKQTMDAGVEYKLYRSTMPYFDIEDTEVVTYTTGYSVGEDAVTFDDQVLGRVGPENPAVPEPDNNYFYAYGLQVVCSNEFTSPLSDQVGKIEFELFETPTRDFSLIGYVLDDPALPDWSSQGKPGIADMNDLGKHIEDNIFEELNVSVIAISTWDPSSQNFVSYGYPSSDPFALVMKQPYRIAIDIDGDYYPYKSVIWAQVGKLPQITQTDYGMIETATTDFVWILQPLEMSGITNSTQLAALIKSDTSDNVNVLAVSAWNGPAQNWTTGSITTRFGYPYRISVEILGTEPIYYWP